jgi:hypothetical protein
MVKSGVAVALLWAPMGANGLGTALFSDVRQPDGGAPTPLLNVFRILHDHFAPGTPLFPATSSAPDVEVLASAKKTLLINKRLEPVTVSLEGKEMRLAANEVRLLDAP